MAIDDLATRGAKASAAMLMQCKLLYPGSFSFLASYGFPILIDESHKLSADAPSGLSQIDASYTRIVVFRQISNMPP